MSWEWELEVDEEWEGVMKLVFVSAEKNSSPRVKCSIYTKGQTRFNRNSSAKWLGICPSFN